MNYLQKAQLLDDPTLEDFGVKLSIILYRNFLLDRSIMCQPNNCLVSKKIDKHYHIHIICIY